MTNLIIIIICIVIMTKITFARELSRLGGDDQVLGVDLRAAPRDPRYFKAINDPRYLKVL